MRTLNVSELMAVTAGRGKPDKAPASSSGKNSKDADRTSNSSSTSTTGRCEASFSWGREWGFSVSCRASDY